MNQIEEFRRLVANEEGSLRVVARRHNIRSHQTVANWRLKYRNKPKGQEVAA